MASRVHESSKLTRARNPLPFAFTAAPYRATLPGSCGLMLLDLITSFYHPRKSKQALARSAFVGMW